MSYLASISLIQEITFEDDDDNNKSASTPDNNDSSSDDSGRRINTLIATLIIVKLLPNVFAMPLGGVLADKYDRRKVQIGIDLTSSLMVMLFLVAVHYRSILVLYFATFCQEMLSGLYIPSNSSIMPLLTSSDRELEKATTLSGLTWSLMAAIGSSTGGLFVALFGIRGCFLIDSVTYVISASYLAFGVEGTFVATEEEKKREKERRRSSVLSIKSTPSATTSIGTSTGTFAVGGDYGSVTSNIREDGSSRCKNNEDLFDYDDDDENVQTGDQSKMFIDGIRFVAVEMPMVGAFALLKGSAALVYGAADVLNVAFSEQGSEDNPRLTSLKLGALFASVGIGCIIGSAASDQIASLSNPGRIFELCLTGYVLVWAGYLMIGLASTSHSFGIICLAGTIRSIGSSLIWIDSTLLLQKFSPTAMLGRVQSLDFSAALLGEAVSALGGGLLLDDWRISPERLSLMLSFLGIGFFILWSPLAFKKMPTTPSTE
jgi:predicted MFS family arabinose efflux permease